MSEAPQTPPAQAAAETQESQISIQHKAWKKPRILELCTLISKGRELRTQLVEWQKQIRGWDTEKQCNERLEPWREVNASPILLHYGEALQIKNAEKAYKWYVHNPHVVDLAAGNTAFIQTLVHLGQDCGIAKEEMWSAWEAGDAEHIEIKRKIKEEQKKEFDELWQQMSKERGA